jgi:hypothetical protein
MIFKYFLSFSIPIEFLPSILATTEVVPDPTKGSSTVSPGFEQASIILLSSSIGFDQYGYNYQAHLFRGRYCDKDRDLGGPDCDITLEMKWSDEWLSNKDCNGDNKLDRGYSCDTTNAEDSC